MGQASKARVARRVPLAVAVSLSMIGSSALAAELQSVDGILQFPNVQVVHAPQAATSPAPQGGMRAYRDSPTSPLRGPSAEEAAAVSRAPLANARRASTSDAATGEAPTFAAAGGGVGAVLDESFMQYSVVTRQADGSLAEVCVTGDDEAAKIVTKQAVVKNARKEIPNDR